MLVLVTGGTGYVGSSIVSALVEQGYRVRMMVRRREQIARSLAPHGVDVSDVIVGDVLDEGSVDRALDGVGAVVHAAAVFSLDPRRAAEITRTNLRATELVVGGAVARGVDPIAYISSTVALIRYGSSVGLPLGDVESPYAISKRIAEQKVRDYQAGGAAIASIYPGGVYGPRDPYFGTQAELLTRVAQGRLPTWPSGGVHFVDVREVAAVVAAALETGRGPRRYVVPGHHIDGDRLFGTLQALTGKRRPHVTVAPLLAGATTRLAAQVNRLLPADWHLPFDPEAIELARRDTRFDTAQTTDDLGVHARPFSETIADTLVWLAEAGRLAPRHLGKLGVGPCRA